MLWSWIRSLASYNSLLSQEGVKPSVSALALCGACCKGEHSGKAGAGLAASCCCSGLGMLSWLGYISLGSASVLWRSLKWRVQLGFKVTLVSALELQVLYSGSQRTSPGEAFFPNTDFSETWFSSSCDLFHTVLIVASPQQVIKRQGIVQQPLNAPSKSNFSFLSFCSHCEFLAKPGNKSV